MKNIFIFIFCLTALGKVQSQHTNLYFKHITIKEGLSENHVLSVFQDSKGFMWFGSAESGLNKYDGYKMVVYKRNEEDIHSISANRIHCITEDKFGNIWVGTGKGLNRYDRKSDKFYSFFHTPGDSLSLSGNSVNAVFSDSSGNLWLGIEVGGLNFYDREKNIFNQ